ncbi:hypothetical protein BK666_01960 [Pseudomonas frederiksbergensis]|uniref:Uncharacterized protein n=1 Tax=Pseudomonas frederiksbergensis TaxID=104087 RepID=A0A423KI82_9PSED|nr:hypothetical protein [Pseudomonas frederiksbergensis]RON52889.1 hypothetical protein BK666_01960 [Pseudomonas frederiksbergensis]
MSALQRFHETASDALEKISANLPAGAKICLAIYTPEKPELDILLQDKGLDLNEVLSTLRRRGLSIDGDNAYKRDLLDSAVGAMAFGVQNRNSPPAGHWGQRFWDIGREERALSEELLVALQAARELWGDSLPPGNSNAMKAMKLVDAAIAKATQ